MSQEFSIRFARHASTAKVLDHEEIEQQTAEFLARGGKITPAKPSEFRVHNNPKVPLVINGKNHADHQAERQRRLDAIPLERRGKGESGYKGVNRVRLDDIWKVTWAGKYIGQYSGMEKAIAAQNDYIAALEKNTKTDRLAG